MKSIRRDVKKLATDAAVPSAAAAPKSEKQKKYKARSKQALKGKELSQFFASMNPYVMTVADPFAVRGVRIPDVITTPSTTFSLTQRFTVQQVDPLKTSACFILGANSVANDTQSAYTGLIPLPNNVAGTTGTIAYSIGQVLQSNDTTFLGSSITDPTNTFIFWDDWKLSNISVQNLFSQVRLVSFGLAVAYTGAPLVASGTLTAVMVPYATARDIIKGGTTFTLNQIQNLPGASVVPINKECGSMARYIPYDVNSQIYVETDTFANSIIPLDAETIRRHIPGVLFVVASGMSPASPWSLQASLVGNYEGVPRESAVNFVSAQVSRSDPIGLAHASNVMEELPTALPTSAPAEVAPPAAGSMADKSLAIQEKVTARSSGQASKLQSNVDSPWGFLSGLLDGEGPLKKAANAIGTIAPMAMALL